MSRAQVGSGDAAAPHADMEISSLKHSDDLLSLYRVMQRIRQAEEQLATLFAQNMIPGFIHSSFGQEAAPAGVIHLLQAGDTIASTHRGHGHAIAKGVDLGRFFAEIMARDGGCCRGRGGSMHVADAAVGMLGANGIVGASLPIALGSALSHQVQGTGAIAVAFFGDGALGEGVVYECMNLARLWSLPLLLVCENNGWSEFTPTAQEFSSSLPKLATAFGIESESIDGNDISEVLAAARRLVPMARTAGPAVLEARTNRIRGHFEGDQQRYRDVADIATAAARDSMQVAELQLEATGVTPDILSSIRQEVAAEIEAAVAFALTSSEPTFEHALDDVYSQARGTA